MAAKRSGKRWIQDAIKNKGALRRAAQRAGAITKRGTIDQDWLDEQAEKGGVIGRRARLAKTLRRLNRRRGR